MATGLDIFSLKKKKELLFLISQQKAHFFKKNVEIIFREIKCGRKIFRRRLDGFYLKFLQNFARISFYVAENLLESTLNCRTVFSKRN